MPSKNQKILNQLRPILGTADYADKRKNGGIRYKFYFKEPTTLLETLTVCNAMKKKFPKMKFDTGANKQYVNGYCWKNWISCTVPGK